MVPSNVRVLWENGWERFKASLARIVPEACVGVELEAERRSLGSDYAKLQKDEGPLRAELEQSVWD